MQNKFQEVMSFLQFEIVDGRVICLYRCSTGPTQALGCDSMDLQDSVQRSLQNPAGKILQICTDLQRSKTWVINQNIIRFYLIYR